MAGRRKFGAPPKRQAQPGERFQIGIRVTPDLKSRLDAAAEQSGRSQSQEAELRLERSFDRADLLPEVLTLAYGPQGAGILMMLGLALTDAGNAYIDRSNKPYRMHWSDDLAALELALLAAIGLLWVMRPISDNSKSVSEKDRERALKVAAEAIRAVRGDDPNNSFYRSPPSPPWCDAVTIRNLLGPGLVERLDLPAAATENRVRSEKAGATVINLMQWLHDSIQKSKSKGRKEQAR